MTAGWDAPIRMLPSATGNEQNATSRLLALRDQVLGRRDQPVIHFPAPPPEDCAEAPFQRLIVEMMAMCGWWLHHETDSRKSTHGFPDLWAVRPPRLLAIELKTTSGAPSLPQLWWMQDLLRCQSDTFEYHYWTPATAQWSDILLAIAPPNTVFDPQMTVAYYRRKTVKEVAESLLHLAAVRRRHKKRLEQNLGIK